MSVQFPLSPSSGFLDRCKDVFSNTDNITEGILWGSIFGISVSNLSDVIAKRNSLNSLIDTSAKKANQVWGANRELLGAVCGTVSATSMVTSWLSNVSLIIPEVLAPALSCIGYGASSIGSLIKLFSTLEELNQSTIAYQYVQDPKAKTDIALSFIKKMVEVAFYTSAVVWGILGSVSVGIGGAALFSLTDLAFRYVLILFLANLGSAILIPVLSNYKRPLLS